MQATLPSAGGKPSGSAGQKWFCGECGSAIHGRNPSHPEPVGIRMGTFDDDPGIRPTVLPI